VPLTHLVYDIASKYANIELFSLLLLAIITGMRDNTGVIVIPFRIQYSKDTGMTKTRFAKLLATREQQQKLSTELLKMLAPASKVLAIAAEHKISAADAAAVMKDMENENGHN
jgi:hypothetical protein